MSEAAEARFEPSFNRAIKIRSMDERLSSDAGVLLVREVDERLGLTGTLSKRLSDPRNPKKIRYTQLELLRERLYAQVLGYSAADDCDRIAHDPAFRLATWDRPGKRVLDERLASQPTQSRLVDAFATAQNREALRAALADWPHRHLRASGKGRGVQRGTIDVDGFPIDVHGRQEGGAYNGYYGRSVYYPIIAAFAPHGDYDDMRLGDGVVNAMLRTGDASPHAESLAFMRATFDRCARMAHTIDFRLDAGFTVGEVLDGLTDSNIRFVGRIRSNSVLQQLAEPYLVRPVGRPPKEGYAFTVELGRYQAKEWRHAQRIVLCVVDEPDPDTGVLDLFPHCFFLVTSWTEGEMTANEVLEHYRRRGTFEDRIGEFAEAIRPRLSSPTFEQNEVSLLLALLALNLGNILRGEMEAIAPSGWDLRRVQTSVLKAGARVVTSSRRLHVNVARSAMALWTLLWNRILRLRVPISFSPPPGPARRKWISPPDHAHAHLVLRC